MAGQRLLGAVCHARQEGMSLTVWTTGVHDPPISATGYEKKTPEALLSCVQTLDIRLKSFLTIFGTLWVFLWPCGIKLLGTTGVVPII